jgi:multiple sugar transport system permease protein
VPRFATFPSLAGRGDRRRLGRSRVKTRLTGWGFAFPGVALIAVVMGFPVIYAGVLAFSSLTFLHARLTPFKGFANFATIFADPLFWNSMRTTVEYSVATVGGEFLLGLAVAVMLNQVVRMKAVYFAILTIPMAMSPVSVGLIWHMLLQPNLGIINTLLESIGIPGVDWLGSTHLAFWTIVGVDIWQQVSFVILILAAGLASLPLEPLEAAAVDGANAWQRFRYVTLPMLRPVAVIAIIIQLINEFRTYDLIYVLTRGGPGVSTDVLSFFAYRRAFLGLALNEGSAIAFVLLLIVLALTTVFFVYTSRQSR